MTTIKGQLLCKEHDLGGYTTYVFRNLDTEETFHKYLMVTRWPNWQTKSIDVGEIGYLTYQEVVAGVDKWWDGTTFIPYNYTNIVFIKFIKENKDNTTKDIIL